ncbi:MAG: aerobic carbon-monoxide dehydrogenase large subunit [Actinomycetota bacterium]|nr:aerobic carbon-monoxide dehydrogenase large subunit [Actinomycetota bacterium]
MTRWIGRPLSRVEDDALIRGAGSYIGDISRPGERHVVFARSSEAHAKIVSIDTSEVRAHPGVLAVFTASEVPKTPMPPFLWDLPPAELMSGLEVETQDHDQHLLATDRVRYVGEPIAMIVATDRYVAEDALEVLEIEYESLEPVVAPTGDSGPLLHDGWKNNVAVRLTVRKGDASGVTASAAHVVRDTFEIQRQAGIPLEGRGAIAEYDADKSALTLWSSTQNVHPLQKAVSRITGVPVEQIRVIAPDVGGGFGTKGVLYPEDLLLAWAALHSAFPLKWIEDRVEHMQGSIHARDQKHRIALAFDADGRIVALQDDFDVDAGAYNPLGIVIPYNSITHLMGAYRVPNFAATATVHVTNKTPMAPYRGAGRPEAVFAMERIMQRAARQMDIDPIELRLRNMVTAEEMPFEVGIPYRDARPIVLDGGDYPGALREAHRHLGATKGEAKPGTVVGTGVAAYVEGTAIGPFEGARVRVEADGRVSVGTGAASQGQGHRTSFAQVCAEVLGVRPDQVDVLGGDTAAIRYGWGTVASRSAVTAGNAVAQAARQVREKICRVAAEALNVDQSEIEIEDGIVRPALAPDRAVPLADLVAGLQPGTPLFKDIGAGLEATEYFEPPTVTWASGVHATRVQVDLGTYEVRVLDYVVVHDCGRIINPMIVDGQIHGGVAQGIGAAFLEEMIYDSDGQLRTGTFMDYLLPTALDVPNITTIHHETHSPGNPLGLKGMGEGGAIPAPAALANAVEDALSDHDIVIRRTPITPDYLYGLLTQPG